VSNTQGGNWGPEDHLSPLPPEYEPVHHEPRRPHPRRADPRQPTGPWPPAQPQSQPRYPQQQPPPPQPPQQPPQQPQQWQPAPVPPGPGWQQPLPPSARPDGDPRQPYPGPGQGQGQYGGDDAYQQGDRFVPGFSDGTDDDWADEGDWVHPGDQDDYAHPDGYSQPPADREPPRKRRRRLRWLAPWLAVLVILTPVAIGGLYAYHLYQGKYHPADFSGAGTGSVLVQVKQGDTATSLAPQLVQLSVVASSRAFVLAAEHSTNTSGLVPGFFRMREHMQASLAYATLVNPANVVEVKITIPEGWRLSRIIATLAATDPHISQAAYEQALKSPALGLPSYADKSNPEGYLFPATYQIQPNATALSVLQQMTQAFSSEVSQLNLVQAAKSVHLSPAQVITMASLVQAEGGKLSDFPKIARVIYNRLGQGMKLQLDSTVMYALNTYGIQASTAQLQTSSPYNTYKYTGLPPGPIDSPGQAAIEAVLHPASGNWVYFVTVDPATGLTLFTNSLTQFDQYQAELEQNLGKG
jgi:UPF0755 protein